MKLGWQNKLRAYGTLSTGLFLAMGLLLLWQSRRAPIGDYANYFYASQTWLNGRFGPEIYEPYRFNITANRLSPEPVFVNFTPVPPVSVLAYLPFALINRVEWSKGIFSLAGLLLFCWGYYRLVRRLCLYGQWWLLLLPFICYTPMLNNFHQGQSYLLLLALLMEGFLQWQKGNKITAALLWAIPIALKLFPVILLLFLLLEKDYRSVFLTIVFSVALSLLPMLFFLPDITQTYFLEIVPRLFRGEINDPFSILYQSGRALLLNSFVYDQHLNPHPLTNLPWLANWGHLLYQTIILLVTVLLMRAKTGGPAPAFSNFALAFLAGLLLTGYGSSYSLMLLVLPALALPGWIDKRTSWLVVGWALLAFAANVPVYWLHEWPLELQFPRLYALLVFIALLCWAIRPAFSPVVFGIIALLFIGKGWFSPPVFPTEGQYYLPGGKYGIIHDYKVKKGALWLWHLNEQGHQLSSFPAQDSIHFSSALSANAGQLFWKGEQLTDSRSQKRRPALLNGRYILYLSDEGRGVGFWTLRKIRLPDKKEE